MIAVAAVTFTAGGMTVANGLAEVGEGLTATDDKSNDGYNFMRDGLMGGNQEQYEAQKAVYRTTAVVGTMICTAYTSLHGPCCFIAGTLVLTEEGAKPIEAVELGDTVYASDPETGKKGYKQVVMTFERETDELIKVTYSGETVTTTSTHPFYSPQKGWTKAIDLRAGDMLVTSNGAYVIIEKVEHELLETPVTVYNFEVEDFHTYYVSANADSDAFVLVHNSCRKYYDATRTDNGVDIGQQISKNQALQRIRSGGDVYANSRSAAKALVKDAFGNSKAYWEVHIELPNAMKHFHDASNHFFHVFFN